MTAPAILAIGGAHIDRRGKMASSFVPGASIPGSMHEDIGGGAFNALRCAVQRGAKGRLLSVRGGDAAGDRVARALHQAGIEDLSAVFLDRSSPSYTALLDSAGDVVAALADMQLYETAFPRQMARAKLRDELARTDAVLCDANIPATGLRKLAMHSGEKPFFAIAISPAKAVRFLEILPAVFCFYMNRREAAAFVGADGSVPMRTLVDRLRARGLVRGVVTDGRDMVVGFEPGGVVAIPPPVPRRVADVTGAGDALAGVMSAALLHGVAFRPALREGMAAALLALESTAAVPCLSQPAFAEALALVPEPVEMR